MLTGEFLTPLGDKNRIALPKDLRNKLAEHLVITRGYERSIILVDKKMWVGLITEINKNPLLNLNVRDTKRFLLGGAFEIELDKQGRFVLPEALVEYAQIENQIVFIGVGEWIEIWDKNRWDEKLKYLAENSADIADRLGNETRNL